MIAAGPAAVTIDAEDEGHLTVTSFNGDEQNEKKIWTSFQGAGFITNDDADCKTPPAYNAARRDIIISCDYRYRIKRLRSAPSWWAAENTASPDLIRQREVALPPAVSSRGEGTNHKLRPAEFSRQANSRTRCSPTNIPFSTA